MRVWSCLLALFLLVLSFSSALSADQITSDPADDRRLSWSPDGSQFAFQSDRGGDTDIWVKALAGGDAIQATTELSIEAMPTWSPLGTKIAYHSDLSGNTDIWVADFNISGAIDDFVRAELRGNYPNPFNPSTTIVFELRESSEVMLQLFDVKGQLVNTLASSYLSPGSYETFWDGTNFSGKEALPAFTLFI